MKGKAYANRKPESEMAITNENTFIRNRLRVIWSAMKERCFNPNSQGYKKYGERGIRVCDEWLDFQNFYNWSLNNGYKYIPDEKGRNTLTIDRIEPNEDYKPSNCRWVDYLTQNTHLSKNRHNRSGYTGLFLQSSGKWLVTLSVNDKSVNIGTFDTQKEGLEARNKYITEHGLKHQIQEYKGELQTPCKRISRFEIKRKDKDSLIQGKKFNRLTAVRRVETDNKKRKERWVCKCDCGAEKIVEESALINGYVKSCGCYRREIAKNLNSKETTGEKK